MEISRGVFEGSSTTDTLESKDELGSVVQQIPP
jgi:hypothetical protein